MDLSFEPLAKLPLLREINVHMPPLWPVRVLTGLNRVMFHILIVLSQEALAILPFNSDANDMTSSEWSDNVVNNSPLFTSHSLILLSELALISLSFLYEIKSRTHSVCPTRVFSSKPDFSMFQIFILLSVEPLARRVRLLLLSRAIDNISPPCPVSVVTTSVVSKLVILMVESDEPLASLSLSIESKHVTDFLCNVVRVAISSPLNVLTFY
jgi:hypothetical protein